jgi:hypothetical protein
MNRLTFDLIFGVPLRAAIVLGAGQLAAYGLLPQGTVQEWVGSVVLVLLALGWSVYEKIAQKAAQNVLIATAIKAPVTATIADVQQTVDAGFGVKVANGAAKVLVPFLLASTLLTGCAAKQYPTLSPETQKQIDATEVATRVNRLMDAAMDAEDAGALTRTQTRMIVTFCVEADKTLVQYPNGWGPTIAQAWKVLKDDPLIKPLLLSNQYVSTAATLVDLALAIWTPKEPEPEELLLEDLCLLLS